MISRDLVKYLSVRRLRYSSFSAGSDSTGLFIGATSASGAILAKRAPRIWRNGSARASFQLMRGVLSGCTIVALALAGCTVRYSAQERASGPGVTTSQVSVAGG